MSNTQRKGDWMQTATGGRFYPLDPRPEEIVIQDIASGLANQCRFAGQCRTFYSIAEHSCYVAQLVETRGSSADDVRWALLHDAAEAYIGDMVRPLKRSMPLYQQVEKTILSVIAEKYGLTAIMPGVVKMADETMLATEARDLMGGQVHDWHLEARPLPGKMTEPVPPDVARRLFLTWTKKLGLL